jgi:hypothetical protein
MGSMCSNESPEEDEISPMNKNIKKKTRKKKGTMKLPDLDTDNILDFMNKYVSKKYKELGPFKKFKMDPKKNQEEYYIHTLENGGRYLGDWNKKINQPHGSGILVSFYFSSFYANMPLTS